MITFARPAVLLILLPVAAAVIYSAGRGGERRWGHVLLRLAASAALTAALAGARAGSETSAVSVCVLADVSESAGDLEATGEVAEEILARLPEAVPSTLAAFARDFQAVAGAGDAAGAPDLAEVAAGLDRAGTALGRALSKAPETLPAGPIRVLALVSDGRENVGAARSAEAAASRLGAAGVRILALPVADPGAGDLFIQEMSLPARVPAGREFTVAVTVAGTAPGTAQVVLREPAARRTVSRREVDLRWGESAKVLFRDRARGRGFVTYAAEVLSAEDPVAANNTASAGLWVEGAAKILLVRPEGTAPSPAARTLRSGLKGAEIEEIAAKRWEPSPEELGGASVVVLENAGEEFLPEATQRMLASHVHDRGCGLLALGGPRALGAGGLTDESPIAAVLPVGLEPPDTRRAHAIFCLDSSASMTSAGPGGSGRSKFDCAREAVSWAAAALGEADAVSVVTFATAAKAHVTGRKASDRKELEAAMASLSAGGSTDLLSGVGLSKEILGQVEAEARHIVLLSDGEPVPGGAEVEAKLVELAGEIARAGGTLSVVGTSPEMRHVELLRQMARAGGGSLHLETRPEELRSTFRRIVLSQTREYVRKGAFTPEAAASHPVTSALSAPPRMDARNRVSPLPGSTDIWTVPGETDEPVLSVCRRGMGRSAVLATAFYEGWAGELASWRDRTGLLGRLAEWLEGEPGENSVDARIVDTRRGRTLEVTVRKPDGQPLDGVAVTAALDAEGRGAEAEVSLAQVGFGRYRSAAPLPKGILSARRAVRVGLWEAGGTPPRRRLGRTSLKRLPPPELTRLGNDRVLLGRLAENSGGRLVESPGELAAEVSRIAAEAAAESTRPLGAALAGAALLLFLVELGVRALRPPSARAGSS